MSAMKLAQVLILLAGLLPVALTASAQTPDAPTAEEDLAMKAEAERYMAFADQIVAALATGQSGAFRASLGPTLIESMSAEEVNGFVDHQVVPFFSDYSALSGTPTIAPIRHPAGLEGFAFFRSFLSKSGQEKPFALYVLEEGGRLVVGNLLVGRSFQDMHPQQ